MFFISGVKSKKGDFENAVPIWSLKSDVQMNLKGIWNFHTIEGALTPAVKTAGFFSLGKITFFALIYESD
jgi:hypothetical protein